MLHHLLPEPRARTGASVAFRPSVHSSLLTTSEYQFTPEVNEGSNSSSPVTTCGRFPTMPISNSSNHKLTVEPTGVTCSCGYENVPSRKLTDGETRALAFQHLIDVQAVSPRVDSKGAREF